MKILYVFFGLASTKYGGGIGSAIIQHCLTKTATVDYIGPELSEEYLDATDIRFNKYYFLKPSPGKVKRIFEILFHDAYTAYYRDWKRLIKTIDPRDYDCVFADYTTYPFVLKWAKKNNLKTVSRAHNVETDYSKAVFDNERSIRNYITYRFTRKLEKKSLKYSDFVLPITYYDKKRLTRLFKYDPHRSIVVPIGINQHRKDYEETVKKKRSIALIGSLWFGANADGAEWFMREVWSKVADDIGKEYELIIAGANPRKDILKLAKSLPNVQVFPNPEDTAPYYQQADIFVAPIFYGSGMKVKVAEAMSYGLQIIATDHALIGYEKSQSVIRRANTAEEYIAFLRELVSMEESEREKERKDVYLCFEKYYSIEANEEKYKEIMNYIISG